MEKNNFSCKCKSQTSSILLAATLFLLLISCSKSAPLGSGNELCEGENCPHNCDQDCSQAPYAPLCVSNGYMYFTFSSYCKYEEEYCKTGGNLTIIFLDHPCATFPPPPEDRCTKAQAKFINYPLEEYNILCNEEELKIKEDNGTLVLQDLIQCYLPICATSVHFKNYQCGFELKQWCWCSDSTGYAIEGTFKKGLTKKDCDVLSLEGGEGEKEGEGVVKTCLYNGNTYDHGERLYHPSKCGLCECLNGTVECWADYIPNSKGELSDSQLSMFKEEMLQYFYLQPQPHFAGTDIRHVRQHPYILTNKTGLLELHFSRYDTNENKLLSNIEQHLLEQEMDSFLSCISFYDHIILLMDGDHNGLINLVEWKTFFGVPPISPS